MPTRFDHNNPPSLSLSFAAAAASASVQVDAEKRILSDVVLCAAGNAQGYSISIDAEFVADLVKFAKKQSKGIKCNLRHNYENLGFQLGRIKNIRADGDCAKGDLCLYANADNSPLAPGMGSWVMAQAEEDPESIMLSIRADLAYYFQRDENGKEVKVWAYNDNDDWISPNYDMPIYGKFAALNACDVVAEGALTDSMFHKNTNQNESVFSKLLNRIEKWFSSNPNPHNQNSDNMSTEKTETTTVVADAAPVVVEETTPTQVVETETPTAPATENVELTAAKGEITNLKLEASRLQGERDAKIVENAALKAELTAARAEIAVLKTEPAAEHTSGQTETITARKGYGPAHDALKQRYNLP